MTTQPVPRDRKILAVAAVNPGLLVLTWDGGSMGFVDMRRDIATLPVFEFLKDPDAFATVQISKSGTSVYWLDHDRDVVDIDTMSLWIRRRAIGPGPSTRTANQGAVGSRALTA